MRQFGNFSRLKLEPPPPLRVLVKLAVEMEEGTKHSRLSEDEIVDVRGFYFTTSPVG
jgi:DNA mismatch repair protein MLH1